MLVSKYKNKDGKVCVSILVSPKQVKDFVSKNGVPFKKMIFSEDYEIGLDKKKKITIKQLFAKVPLNN